MHQLAVVPPSAAGLPALADAELDAARSFAEQEKAAATRRAYRSDFVIFAAWGRVRSAEPLPASPAAAAAFLAAEANAGAKASTITRRAAAIRYAHRLAGHEPPVAAGTVVPEGFIVPAGSLVAGVPAAVKRSDVDPTWIEFAVKSYIETARHHRNGLRRLH